MSLQEATSLLEGMQSLSMRAKDLLVSCRVLSTDLELNVQSESLSHDDHQRHLDVYFKARDLVTGQVRKVDGVAIVTGNCDVSHVLPLYL